MLSHMLAPHLSVSVCLSVTLVVVVLDEAELVFLSSLMSFAHQMKSLKLNDTQLALLCALTLINPSLLIIILLVITRRRSESAYIRQLNFFTAFI